MMKHWSDTEEEASRLIKLINGGTDQDLVKYLDSICPELLRSAVTHTAKFGETVLHLAAVRNKLGGIRAMLRSKVDVNTRNGYGHSPLYACLFHNSMSSARLLVDFGADVNEIVCRQTRESLLHRMIKGDRTSAVEFLLDANAFIEIVTNTGDTPLHFAARFNRLKMAKLLIEKGADINASNTRQETPLHVAITNGSLDVAKALVKNKANTTIKDKNGTTALHSAVAADAMDLVHLMLTINSTQINSKEALLGRTPLLLACSNSSQEMVTLLLTHGADANLTTNYRRSVLHVAACSGKADVLSTVIKHTTNPNALSINNKTPLHCAVMEEHFDAVKRLLKAGVNINLKDIDGNTALHMASKAGNDRIVWALLQHGAQINATNMRRQSALHLALVAGHENTGSILLEAGCNPEILDVQETKARDYLVKFRSELMDSKNSYLETDRISGKLCVSDVNHELLHSIQDDEIDMKKEEMTNVNCAANESSHRELKDSIKILDNRVNDTSDNTASFFGSIISEVSLANGLDNLSAENKNEKSADDNDEKVYLKDKINEDEDICKNGQIYLGIADVLGRQKKRHAHHRVRSTDRGLDGNRSKTNVKVGVTGGNSRRSDNVS